MFRLLEATIEKPSHLHVHILLDAIIKKNVTFTLVHTM